MDSDIRKTIKKISPNGIINILLVLFGVILAVRIIFYYSDYREEIIDAKNKIHTTVNDTTSKTIKEIFEIVIDPLRISDLDHWLAEEFLDLKKKYGITTKIIVPPPIGISTEKRSELSNTHKRVMYWIEENQDALEVPEDILTMFINRMENLETHSHQKYDEHVEFGHDHEGANEEVSKSHDTLPLKEYQNILNDLNSPLWLMEDKIDLEKIYRFETRTGIKEINAKDLVTVYQREQGSIIEHYVTILRSKVEKAQYCDSCHGYEEGKPVLISFYTDTNDKIIPITQHLKNNILKEAGWFVGIIFLGAIGSFFIKRNIKIQIESEKRFRAIFEGAAFGIVLSDLEGRFLQINPALEKMFGYREKELQKLSFVDLTYPDDIDKNLHYFNELIRGERNHYQMEKRYYRKDGKLIWGRLSVSLVRDMREAPSFGIGMIEDITKRKQEEQERIRLATAVDQAVEAIVITDTEGTIQYVNPSFEKITGYSREEAIGKNSRILSSGEQGQEFYNHMWNTITNGQTWRNFITNKKKDGTLYMEDMTISPIRNEAGNIINYVSMKYNVTHERELEEQLRRAQKTEAIGRLAGGIAHDFNNILTSILGYTELLQMEMQDEHGKGREYLENIYSSGTRAKDLVLQILLFSRQAESKKKPVYPKNIVEEIVKFIRPTLPTTISVKQKIDSTPPIYADASQIHQVLVNLCINASHAMPEGGKLVLRLKNDVSPPPASSNHGPEIDNSFICLSVQDTGFGMDKDLIGRIFDPFFTTKEEGKGTGLGLSVVLGIVESHGGRINVESEVGKGTSFNIYLPVSMKEEYSDSDGTSTSLTHGEEHILLVDDELLIKDLAQAMLIKLGYSVTGCTDSNEALEIFRSKPEDFDLIITDYTMPTITGIRLAEKFKEIRPDVPIILSTGFAEAVDKEKLPSVISKILMKPYKLKELSQVVRKVLDKPGS